MDEIKGKIYTTFASTAACLGYSEIHGRIIGCLLINQNPVQLAMVAKETGYSPSMVSLSLDFLESIGMVKRVKKHGDRRLYIQMNGDLLNGLKKAIALKLEKSTNESKEDFERYRREIRTLPEEERRALTERLDTLEKEVRRFNRYVQLVARVKLP